MFPISFPEGFVFNVAQASPLVYIYKKAIMEILRMTGRLSSGSLNLNSKFFSFLLDFLLVPVRQECLTYFFPSGMSLVIGKNPLSIEH